MARGRKPRNTEKEAKIAKVLDAVSRGRTVTGTLRQLKIPFATWYDWLRADPELQKRVDDAFEAGTDAIEDALTTRAAAHDTTAAIFLLKSRRPERFSEKHQHAHMHGGEVRVKWVSDNARPDVRQITSTDEDDDADT